MSFARAKITRFNEKHLAQPNGTGGLKPKSQIPKIYRSVSQPPSPTRETPRTPPITQKRPKHGAGEGPNVGKPCNLTAVNENSVHSDDYKDALEDKTEVDNIDSLKDSTQLSIAMKESLASRSSNSGIPLPLKNTTSKQSTNRTPRSKSEQSGECRLVASPKRTLELQFLTKKKRLDVLKKELEFKQKPVFELYESLLQIKNKLEQSGKVVPLETLKLLDYESLIERPLSTPSESILSGGEMVKSDITELTTEFLKNLKIEMSTIPQTCVDLGSYLIKQREEVLRYLGELKEKDSTIVIEEFVQDSMRLNQMVEETVLRQTSRIERVLVDISSLFEKNNVAVANQVIHDLERKVKDQAQEIISLSNELNHKEKLLKDLQERKDESTQKIMDENIILKERIKTLEGELQAKKRKLSDQGMSSKSYEQKIEALTKHGHDLEKAKKDADTKVTEITSHFRTLQNKVKLMEQKWRDEKEELLKSHKGEHAILEKLTAERQALDTRVNLMNNILDEQKKSNEAEQEKLHRELLMAKEQIEKAAVEKQMLDDKMKALQQEIASLSLQQQQAVDVIRNMDSDGNFVTENESQLNTEVLALRVSLRAAQERIETYTTEKMRFIDSIEKLNCSGDAKESLGKALVQKEETITQLQYECKMLLQEMESQKLTIDQLRVEIENLQAGAIVNNFDNIPHDTQELQSMLEEGKAKLQKALTKSLENEQKLLKYEHDMNQLRKQLNDMENLLKVRDGLISMLKVKKDELVLENESLNKYSEEVRQLLFETKEELMQKNKELEQTKISLEDKGTFCYKLEKKIRELETTLSETNEKRYKLQDTVSCMEKELQTTKAHINQIAEMQTRYDIGMPQLTIDTKQNVAHKQQYNITSSNNSPQQNRQAQKVAVVHNMSRPASPNKRQYAITAGMQISPDYKGNVRSTNMDLIPTSNARSTNNRIRPVQQHKSQKQLETPHIGDNPYVKTMYYYVPKRNIQNYANYMRKNTQTASNSIYRCYRAPCYRPLTQSLVSFNSVTKMKNTKRNSSPVLQSQKNVQIQTAETTKYNSATQTVVQNNKTNNENIQHVPQRDCYDHSKETLDVTKAQLLDPYKLCCAMLSREHADLQSTNTATLVEEVEEKDRERKDFITAVNRLSEFDSRDGEEKLGLGKEFTPIVFGGVRKYRVLNSGSLMWCHPSREMQINNMIIATDIKAHISPRPEPTTDKTQKILII